MKIFAVRPRHIPGYSKRETVSRGSGSTCPQGCRFSGRSLLKCPGGAVKSLLERRVGLQSEPCRTFLSAFPDSRWFFPWGSTMQIVCISPKLKRWVNVSRSLRTCLAGDRSWYRLRADSHDEYAFTRVLWKSERARLNSLFRQIFGPTNCPPPFKFTPSTTSPRV